MALPGGTPPRPRRSRYTSGPDWPAAVRLGWLVFLAAIGLLAVASPAVITNVPWLR